MVSLLLQPISDSIQPMSVNSILSIYLPIHICI